MTNTIKNTLIYGWIAILVLWLGPAAYHYAITGDSSWIYEAAFRVTILLILFYAALLLMKIDQSSNNVEDD